jgi:hypothetical protein
MLHLGHSIQHLFVGNKGGTSETQMYIYTYMYKKIIVTYWWTRWHVPVISAPLEAEVKGSCFRASADKYVRPICQAN